MDYDCDYDFELWIVIMDYDYELWLWIMIIAGDFRLWFQIEIMDRDYGLWFHLKTVINWCLVCYIDGTKEVSGLGWISYNN